MLARFATLGSFQAIRTTYKADISLLGRAHTAAMAEPLVSEPAYQYALLQACCGLLSE